VEIKAYKHEVLVYIVSVLLHDLGVSSEQFNQFNASHSITYYNLVIPTEEERLALPLYLNQSFLRDARVISPYTVLQKQDWMSTCTDIRNLRFLSPVGIWLPEVLQGLAGRPINFPVLSYLADSRLVRLTRSLFEASLLLGY